MPALSVHVQLRRHLGIFQCKKIDHGILHVYWIVFGLNDKRRRRLRDREDLGIEREVLFRQRQIGRIDQHRKIRPATQVVGGVDEAVESLLEVVAERSS